MKQLVANRVPPGDRWALIDDESDIVFGSLTDCLNQVYNVHKATQFFDIHIFIEQITNICKL